MLDKMREKLVRLILGNKYDTIDELLESIEDLTAMNIKLQKENRRLQDKLSTAVYYPTDDSVYTFTYTKKGRTPESITYVLSEDEYKAELNKFDKLLEKGEIERYGVKEAGIHSNIYVVLKHMNIANFARLVKNLSNI